MTIKEVAKLAGVSPAAVSRYMNGGSISVEKAEKIKAVIQQTGYRPNPTAQTMRTGRGGQIGIIVPKVYSDSVSQILDGVSARLSEKNYMLILGTTGGDREKEIRYIESMQNSQVAGIILMGTVMSQRLRDAIAASEKPVVVTGQNFQGIPCVYHDDFNAVKELTRRMLETGRKHIAFIGATDEDAAAGKARRLGCERAWTDAGYPLEKLHEAVSPFTAAGGCQAMQDILSRFPETDGVICATDRMAHGAMHALRSAGRRIPEDVAIAGVGDNWADTISQPTLTTAHLYFRQCGITAADMLLKLIESEGQESPVSQTMLEYTIVERESM